MIHWSGVWEEVVFLQIKHQGSLYSGPHIRYSKSPTHKPSSCKLPRCKCTSGPNKEPEPVPLTSGMREIAARPLSPVPRWLSWWRICLQCRRSGFDSWVGKIPWRRERLPTLAGRIPWTEELGRLQCLGSQRVRHDWVTLTSFSSFHCVS